MVDPELMKQAEAEFEAGLREYMKEWTATLASALGAKPRDAEPSHPPPPGAPP
jgi:hypothetical protein